MPAEPELPPVEAMLRDAARRRRAAFDAAGPGPATMPGPTRARLHEELARRFDEVPAWRTTSGGMARWWLALAGAAGAAAIVALFVVADQKAPERPAVVATRSAPAAPPEVAALPAPAPARPEPVAPAAPQVEVARESTAARQDQPADDAAVASTSSKAKDAPGFMNAPATPAGILRAQTFTQTPLPPAAAPMKEADLARRAAPAASSAPGARGGSAATSQANAARPSLLGNFRFEQRGENVRVVDADGSVYVGQVQVDKAPAQVQAAPRANKVQSAKQAADAVTQPQEAAGENFRFRATGDNRTLRKPVVFEGEYTAPQPDTSANLKLESRAATALPPPNPEAQIRGRVRVLDGREGQRGAEVDARAVEAAAPK